MAFDIYGNILEKGFCEVHPWVKEEYPCSLCMSERRTRDEKRNAQHVIAAEEHAQFKRLYYEFLAEENSLKYRILCRVEIIVSKYHEKIKAHKEKELQRIGQKHDAYLKNKKNENNR